MRLRITFSKSGALRYTGHLDLHTVWERTIRRAGLPLAYTQGFHPGPRIQIASALPLGIIGCAELVDIWVHADQPLDAGTARDALQASSPPGLGIRSVEEVDEKAPTLQKRVVSALYRVTFLEPVSLDDLTHKIADLLGQTTIMRERRGKPYDLHPLVEALDVEMELTGGVCLRMQLAAREGATGRPEEVLVALGLEAFPARIERLQLILDD
jgi:radical SAM-linked protein